MNWVTRFKRIKAAARDALNGPRVVGVIYVTLRKFLAIRQHVVLLESHKGADFIGSPYYMARYLLASARYLNFRLVIVRPRKSASKIDAIFSDKRVTFCQANSLLYSFHLATAAYLVNDVTFPIYFSRRKEQKYLNTWHGTPLKALGRRTAKNVFLNIANTQRNFLHATDILAPNSHTENVLLKDYMIEKIWRGRVLRGGYPRNDVLVNVAGERPFFDGNVLNVVFMPTWRGTLSTIDAASDKQILALSALFEALERTLPDGIMIWVRLHPMARGAIDLTGYRRLREFPENMEAYAHLAACDALVTDYSSVMFDYAVTGRPIILYTPDIGAYREERNFCLDITGLPFLHAYAPEDLVRHLSVLMRDGFLCGPAYEQFVAEYCPHDHGQSTALLCAQFFLGEAVLECREVRPDPAKKTILLMGGGFLKNGITTSLKSLLFLIDKDKFNIVIYVDMIRAEKNSGDYFASLPNEISYIPVRPWLAVDILDGARFFIQDIFFRPWGMRNKLLRALWSREYERLFGSAIFDVMVSFEGYARRDTFLMLDSSARKVVFFHNDMAQEVASGRVSDPQALRLSYELADVVATVRSGAEIPYCEKYFDFKRKTMHVPNTFSLDCVSRALRPLEESFAEDSAACVPDVIRALHEPGKIRFINLARFSPEKGQLRLIDAFERIWLENSATQLFIVGGHGVSYDEVVQRASASAASMSIFVIKGSGNPFPLIKRMDTFIFSSFYEGAPIVLFEAMALGLPIVATDILGPSGLLGQGYGLLVENSLDGLVSGMRLALAGEVPQRPYDFVAHNAFALEQFYRAVGVQGPGHVVHDTH